MCPDPTPRSFDGNRLRLHGLSWAGTGMPTLMVHATSFCAATWQPVWRAVHAAGWEGPAVAFDQRGHGHSDAPGGCENYQWTHLVDDLVSIAEIVLGEERDPRILLVGHSSGGTTALAAAGRRPDCTAGVVLIEPVLFTVPVAEGEDSFAGSVALAERTRRRRADFESRAAAHETLVKRFPYSRFAPETFSAFLDGGLVQREGESVRLCCDPEHEAWMYQGAPALDVWPWVEKVRSPVLLIVGEHSAVPAALQRRLSERASTRVETVPSATHFAALEQPEAVGRLIAEFARSCAEAPGP